MTAQIAERRIARNNVLYAWLKTPEGKDADDRLKEAYTTKIDNALAVSYAWHLAEEDYRRAHPVVIHSHEDNVVDFPKKPVDG